MIIGNKVTHRLPLVNKIFLKKWGDYIEQNVTICANQGNIAVNFSFFLGVFLKSLSNEAFDNSPRPEIEDFIKLGESLQIEVL